MPRPDTEVPGLGTASDAALGDALARMVAAPDYPCLGARSVFQRGRATLRVYPQLGSPEGTPARLADLRAYPPTVDLDSGFASFVAVFRGPPLAGEEHFEQLLWRQLGLLHALDDVPWSAKVSPDPADAHFSFSVAGAAYFVVGLHPLASRAARRAATPTLVFNLHEQFERLRASGRYVPLRDRIRERDRRLQGSVNPLVGDHGQVSEARQYSGRHVEPGWRAPFPR